MGADLNNIIRTQRLTDDHVQFLVYQMLRGLKYIHSAGIQNNCAILVPQLIPIIFSQASFIETSSRVTWQSTKIVNCAY